MDRVTRAPTVAALSVLSYGAGSLCMDPVGRGLVILGAALLVAKACALGFLPFTTQPRASFAHESTRTRRLCKPGCR